MCKQLVRVVTVAAVVLMTSQLLMADIARSPRESVPALSEWGMIAAAVALGLGGAYRIRKYKK